MTKYHNKIAVKRKDDNVLQGESIYHCLYLSNSWTTNQNMLMFSKVFREVSLNKSSGADPSQSALDRSGSALFASCFAFVMYYDKKSFILSQQNMSIGSKEPLSQLNCSNFTAITAIIWMSKNFGLLLVETGCYVNLT